MPRGSPNQTDFTGGEWGSASEGRSDNPGYLKALKTCLNQHPIEEGPVIRRSGTAFIVPTHNRQYAKLLGFDGSDTCAFAMEFTPTFNLLSDTTHGALRFITQDSLVFDNTVETVTSTTAGNTTIHLSGNPGWVAQNEVMFNFPDVSGDFYPFPVALEAGLRNRLCHVNSQSGTTLFIRDDAETIGLPLTTPNGWLIGAQVQRVKILQTPYTTIAQLQALRAVQAEYQSVILCPSVIPQCVQVTTQGTATTDPVFSFAALTMIDGPYLDPQTQTLTLSALTGAVTAIAGSAVFAATDVGRHMRVFTQPPAWNVGTAYVVGNQVTDGTGAWWSCVVANTGQPPGQPVVTGGSLTTYWVPAPLAGSWAWGKITAYTSSTQVTWTIDTTIPNMTLQTANGTTAFEWQLGVYSASTTYPTCGTYYQGRLWLAGAVPNRFDTTVSNGIVLGVATFSPTDPYGNVLDNSGLSEILNSRQIDNIQWMIADHQGVIAGTINGEYLIQASSLSDPITPTSIQQAQVTKYGSENIEPVRAGISVVFAQKYGRRVIEHLADAFSQRFGGRHLNEFAKHLTKSGIAEVAYQEELAPIVWVRMNNGLLAGCTYRRVSRFLTEPPVCEGWHWNMHGANRVFTSMCVVPGNAGLLDRLFVVTNDPGQAQNYFVEILQPDMDDQAALQQGWFLDQSPASGPGVTAGDCGGGNAFAYPPSGGMKGADTVVPDMTNVPPQPGGFGIPGQSPPAGGQVLAKFATFFNGTTTLYNLPKFPSAGASADEHAVSMSVWVGAADYPLTAGALLSSPALTSAEVIAGTNPISALLGGGSNTEVAGTNFLAYSTAGQYPAADAQISSFPGGLTWLHFMISAKDDGAGNLVTTCYVNDTQLFLNSATNAPWAVVGTPKAWPFHTQPDAMKAFGLAVWAIGGANILRPLFTPSVTYQTGNPIGRPPGFNNPPIPPSWRAAQRAGVSISYQYTDPVTGKIITTATPIQTAKQTTFTSAKATITGGSGNIATEGATGGYSGYRGSVAELWIDANRYVDWSNAANRALFHEFDSITSTWGPVSLGKDGSTPFSAKPWIYLSGGPTIFNLNRATGNRLTVTDTFNSSLSAAYGLQPSPLSFP